MKTKISHIAPIEVASFFYTYPVRVLNPDRVCIKKDITNSGTNRLEYSKCAAPNSFYANKAGILKQKQAGFAQKIVILQNS
jgi:hypothetical protein